MDESMALAPVRGHAALRRGRVSEAQRIYLLTFVTDARVAWFANGPLAEAAIAALLDRRSWARSTLLAWVLMPDHWHGVVELGPDESLPALVRQLKCSSSRRVRAAMGATVPWAVWASAYHDRALRKDEGLLAMARYVVMNPVRAGLVERVQEYPYWDAVWAERKVAIPAVGCAVATCVAPTGSPDGPEDPVGATQVATATTELRRTDPLAETPHAGALRNNTIPPTINPTPPNFNGVNDSPNNIDPINTVPAAPIPVHTAYATPTGSAVNARPSSHTNAPRAINDTAVQPGRV
nr:transposase [Lysobacter enzymogenes]